MDRKEFLKKIGLAAGCAMLPPGAHPRGVKTAENQKQDGMAHRQKFKEAWITSLMENMEAQLGGEQRSALMESCGRNCARRSSVHKAAESSAGKVEDFVNRLAGFLGKENCYIEGDTAHLKYPKCYCELVDKGPERLPDTYCFCSRGWVMEMFETAAGKPVHVEMLSTIKRGGDCCEFVVRL